jgi:hypothetical protein
MQVYNGPSGAALIVAEEFSRHNQMMTRLLVLMEGSHAFSVMPNSEVALNGRVLSISAVSLSYVFVAGDFNSPFEGIALYVANYFFFFCFCGF